MKKEKKLGIIGGVVAVIIIGIIVSQFSSINDVPIQDNDSPEIVDVDRDSDGIPDENDPYIGAPRVWQTSGPFQIDKEQYSLGELVLIRIGLQNELGFSTELKPDEKGQIVFLMPSNGTHQTVYITIPFDGSEKVTFNQYFKPQLSTALDICSKDDLLGSWTVVFQGTNYKNLKFEIIDEYIPGDEKYYETPIC